MRRSILVAVGAMLIAGGCGRFEREPEVERALDAVGVIDQANLNEVMLGAADPAEAVAYFARATEEKPDRIDLRRGLAAALVRAGQTDAAIGAWERVVDHPASVPEDRVKLAGTLIRTGNWDRAEEILRDIPPTYETAERYRLEAMVADSRRDWDRSDAFYENAVGLTTDPAGILNNWGYSRLSRGDHAGAERLFQRALGYEPGLFTAKNNLVLARGAQREYTLPVVDMTQTERAMLLHTLALSAIKQGDVATGRALLNDAIETHPQHFETAARSLEALEAPEVTAVELP